MLALRFFPGGRFFVSRAASVVAFKRIMWALNLMVHRDTHTALKVQLCACRHDKVTGYSGVELLLAIVSARSAPRSLRGGSSEQQVPR